jgi:17beta-estradiol 17-dehydrogenase / very-long-chain 3-oxoacyl-CoA reductase
MLTSLIFYTGLIFLLKSLFSLLYFLYRFFLRPKLDLLSRYGRNSYALVTGGTDGIGQEFCFQLAELGFNLVIISRNKAKLQETKRKITEKSPGVEVVVVQADFSKSYEDGFFGKIE